MHVVPNPGDATHFTASRKEFVNKLHALVAAAGAEKALSERARICFFVYDEHEKRHIDSMLLQTILDDSTSLEMREKAVVCALTLLGNSEAINAGTTADLMLQTAAPGYPREPRQGKEYQDYVAKYDALPEDFKQEHRRVWEGDNKKYSASSRDHEGNKKIKVPGKAHCAFMMRAIEFCGLADDDISLEDVPSRLEQRVGALRKDVEEEVAERMRPRIAVLHTFVRRHFVLPVPGFYEFADVVLQMLRSRAQDSEGLSERAASRKEVQDLNQSRIHDIWTADHSKILECIKKRLVSVG